MLILYVRDGCAGCEKAKSDSRGVKTVDVTPGAPGAMDARADLMSWLSNADLDLDTPLPILVDDETGLVQTQDEHGNWRRTL
jgi:hypothetical protein